MGIFSRGTVKTPDAQDVHGKSREAISRMLAVPLGYIAEDSVTGIKGCTLSSIVFINGCVQVLIQPRGDSKEAIPKQLFFDVSRLSFGTTEVMPVIQRSIEDIEFPLGAKLRSKATGFEGVVTSIYLAFNGSINYDLQPKSPKNELGFVEYANPVGFDALDLELIPEPKIDIATKDVGFANQPTTRRGC